MIGHFMPGTQSRSPTSGRDKKPRGGATNCLTVTTRSRVLSGRTSGSVRAAPRDRHPPASPIGTHRRTDWSSFPWPLSCHDPVIARIGANGGRVFLQGSRRDVPRDTAEYQRHDDRYQGVELSDFVEMAVHEGRDRQQRQQYQGAPQATRGPTIPEESKSHPKTRRYVTGEQTGVR